MVTDAFFEAVLMRMGSIESYRLSEATKSRKNNLKHTVSEQIAPQASLNIDKLTMLIFEKN
jgi:hypothetical protein